VRGVLLVEEQAHGIALYAEAGLHANEHIAELYARFRDLERRVW